MKQKEGMPFVKLMMLISSLAPLFLLIGIRGILIKNVNNELLVSSKDTWIILSALIIVPYLILKLRIKASRKSKDIFLINTVDATMNKEYLFTYLITVLLPLYSITITSMNELYAIVCAVLFVLFVFWNMNMHFLNILFAIKGYRVYTLPMYYGSILLTTRQHIPRNLSEIKAHRISNSVFIELKNYKYDA